MRLLLDMFGGDVNLALAGYNAGEGAVMKYGYKYRRTAKPRNTSAGSRPRYGSISDGRYIQTAQRLNNNTAKLVQKQAQPLTVLEVAPVTIRTADGKMMLMNQ